MTSGAPSRCSNVCALDAVANRTLLAGGVVVDGAGAPLFRADVLIEGGIIAGVGSFEAPPDARRIDCSSLTVSPGFIDCHCHSDLQALEDRKEKIRQGVTTEIVGNCGFSAFPCGEDPGELHQFANGIFCGGASWGWRTARGYSEAAMRGRGNVSVFSLVGHGTLRIWRAGLRQGPLESRDVDAMERRLAEDLCEGAAGFSTGLMYAPGSSAPFEELERLCRVAARHGKIYATHMRNYFGRVLESLDEQIELARRTGCRLQISHLQVAGRRHWSLKQRAIERVEQARAAGIDVAFDCYPYLAGSTVLSQILPQWALEGGTERLLARLSDAETRGRIVRETLAGLVWDWTDIYISAVQSEANQSLVGMNIAEAAGTRGREPVETVMDLLAEEGGAVNMISFNQSEENLRRALAHPLSLIASDGFYVRGRPHPRLCGTFPRFLGYYVREQGLLPLEQAVEKITGAPARRFGLSDRGRIAPGLRADVVVFDAASIASKADYRDPEAPPDGIRHVFRGGAAAAL